MNLKGEPACVGRHCGSNRYDVTPEVVAFYASLGYSIEERISMGKRL